MSDYNLDALGWYQFENLIQALLRAAYGASVEAWGKTADGGKDAYSASALRFPDPKQSTEGPFIFQMKFVSLANAVGSKPSPVVIKAVRAEMTRIQERMDSGVWRNPKIYVFITNAPLSGNDRNNLHLIIKAQLPESEVILWSGSDVGVSLDAFPKIRFSFPQILGLRDLNELIASIVNKDLFERSTLQLEISAKFAEVFVPTRAYEQARHILDEHGFAVLTGPPEIGKTITARMIALAHLSDGWEAYETSNPEEILKLYNREMTQIFVADDAFGSTEYQPDRGAQWAQELDRLLRIVDKDHFIIFTSRPAPLSEALNRMRLQGAAEAFPSPAQVQVDASELSTTEKAQMLYRYAKRANFSDEEKDVIRQHIRTVIDSKHFTPLRIQQFVDVHLHELLADSAMDADAIDAAIRETLAEPTKPFKQSFNNLHTEHQAALISLVNSPGAELSSQSLEDTYIHLVGNRPDKTVRDLLSDLNGQFIRFRTHGDSGEFAEWMHPSVRDLVIDCLMNNGRFRHNFLQGARLPGILLAISIGGGALGKRTFPLLINQEDWAIWISRVEEHLGDPDGSDNMAILEALRVAVLAGTDDTKHQKICEATTRILEVLVNSWKESDVVLSVPILRAWYALSEGVGCYWLSPILESTWSQTLADAILAINHISNLRSAPGESLDAIEDIEAVLDLFELLSQNNSRFLKGVNAENKIQEMIAQFVSTVSLVVKDLESLDPDETTLEQEEDGPTFEMPVSPMGNESDECEWLDTILPVLKKLSYEPYVRRDLQPIIEIADTRLEERTTRSDNWNSFGDRGDYEYEGTRDVSFDIEAFFSDL